MVVSAWLPPLHSASVGHLCNLHTYTVKTLNLSACPTSSAVRSARSSLAGAAVSPPAVNSPTWSSGVVFHPPLTEYARPWGKLSLFSGL